MEKNDFEIDLLEYWNVLKKRKGMIAVVTFVGIVASIVYALTAPRAYEATAAIMPISESSPASMLGGETLLAGFLPIAGGAGSDTRKFTALLKSRTLAADVIQKMELMPILYKDQWDPAKKNWKTSNPESIPQIDDAAITLKNNVNVQEDQLTTGLLNLIVTADEPRLAADIANQYTKSLQEFINKNSLTVEKQQRLFLEEQLRMGRMKFLNASKELAQFFKTNSISNVKSVIDVDVNSGDLGPLEESIDALNRKTQELEEQTEKMKQKYVVKEVPAQLYLAYLTEYVKLLAGVNRSLEQQLASSKFKEGKENLSFHVVDPAIPELIPVKPRRKLIVILSTIASFFTAIMASFGIEYVSLARVQLKK